MHRQRQANRYIIALQNVIAEKSFQFSNIIQAAPRKSVVTRARNAVAKLNASGAIKDPNTPESSNVQLSWIWQMSDADNDSPTHIRECMYGLVFQY